MADDPTLETTIVGKESAPQPAAPPPGPDTRIGHYVLESELGRGGMGIVFRAKDMALSRPVALKMILDARRAGPGALARFRREATATAKLRHPGIVTVFDVGEHEGRPYVVLELIEGESLAAMIARGPLDPRRAAELARGVARALAHAHENGITHRDVKPGNVLVEKGGEPRLMDFGLAHVAEDSDPITRTGEILGTPAYMAPEQASGRSHGPAADVYGLGAVLYHMLAGKAPHEGSNIHALIIQVIEKDPPSLRRLRPDLPVDLETIAHRCLAKEPWRRYASASDLADDLDRWLAGKPIHARPVGRVERVFLWVRRDRRLAAAIVALAVVAAIAAVFAARLAWRVAEEVRHAKEADDARRDRVERARALLASVRSGDIENQPGGVQYAMDQLVALHDPEVVALLAEELDRQSALLLEGARVVYLSAQPLDGLEHAVNALGGDTPEPPDPRDVAVLRAAERRCEERARNPGIGGSPRMGALVAAEQARRLGPAGVRIARIACEALGRIGQHERAEESLHRYLVLERDELRASFAGEALARLGGEAAEAHVRRTAWHRFGNIDGVYWQRVSPILAQRAGPLPAEAAAVASRCLERIQVLEQRGDYPAAVAEIEKDLATISQRSPELWASLGRARSHTGDIEGGIEALSRAIELDPVQAAFWATRAWLRQEKGDLDGALADSAKAIQIKPSFHGGWTNSAVAHRGRGENDQALPELSRALELEPDDEIALLNRGDIRAERGDVPGALKDLDRVIELKPRWGTAYEHRAALNRRRGAMGAAIADASRATEVAPKSATAWCELASAHLANGEPAAAVTAATRAIELNPRYPIGYLVRGGARASQRDVDGGLADFSSAIAIDSRCVAAIANRGSLRAARGDLKGGIEDFTRAIEVDPRVPERWFNRGHARFVKGDLDDAIADLTRAIELKPTLAGAWGDRGLARKKKGDKAGAKSDLRRALELGPNMPGSKAARQALAELEQAETKDDDDDAGPPR